MCDINAPWSVGGDAVLRYNSVRQTYIQNADMTQKCVKAVTGFDVAFAH